MPPHFTYTIQQFHFHIFRWPHSYIPTISPLPDTMSFSSTLLCFEFLFHFLLSKSNSQNQKRNSHIVIILKNISCVVQWQSSQPSLTLSESLFGTVTHTHTWHMEFTVLAIIQWYVRSFVRLVFFFCVLMRTWQTSMAQFVCLLFNHIFVIRFSFSIFIFSFASTSYFFFLLLIVDHLTAWKRDELVQFKLISNSVGLLLPFYICLYAQC